MSDKLTGVQLYSRLGRMKHGDRPVVLANNITGQFEYVTDVHYDPDLDMVIIHADSDETVPR